MAPTAPAMPLRGDIFLTEKYLSYKPLLVLLPMFQCCAPVCMFFPCPDFWNGSIELPRALLDLAQSPRLINDISLFKAALSEHREHLTLELAGPLPPALSSCVGNVTLWAFCSGVSPVLCYG